MSIVFIKPSLRVNFILFLPFYPCLIYFLYLDGKKTGHGTPVNVTDAYLIVRLYKL